MRLLAVFLSLVPAASQDPPPVRVLRVPEDHPGVQAALDAAREGDTVSVAPGVYRESLRLAGKNLLLTGRGGGETVLEGREGAVLLALGADLGPATRVTGLTFRNAGHAVVSRGRASVIGNRFTGNGDAMSYENGGGLCQGNVFEKNRDDAVDVDGSSDPVIESNEIRDCGDDGIEVRLHAHKGRPLEILIRGNTIVGSREDGIQLIDYPGASPRTFRIERNVIAGSRMAGLGCMADGDTKEDYSGAPIPERVLVVHNTFVENEVGVCGGGSMILVNNLLVGHRRAAFRRVGGDSAQAGTLFWKNGADAVECDLEGEGVRGGDPRLDERFRPAPGGAAVDAGVTAFEHRGEHWFGAPPGSFAGSAPDLGAFERRD